MTPDGSAVHTSHDSQSPAVVFRRCSTSARLVVLARVGVSMALVAWTLSACSSGGEGKGTPSGCQPSAKGTGQLSQDCATYCALYETCKHCDPSVTANCQSACEQNGNATCLKCVVNNAADTSPLLQCSTYAEAGVFTITWNPASCGGSCTGQ